MSNNTDFLIESRKIKIDDDRMPKYYGSTHRRGCRLRINVYNTNAQTFPKDVYMRTMTSVWWFRKRVYSDKPGEAATNWHKANIRLMLCFSLLFEFWKDRSRFLSWMPMRRRLLYDAPSLSATRTELRNSDAFPNGRRSKLFFFSLIVEKESEWYDLNSLNAL